MIKGKKVIELYCCNVFLSNRETITGMRDGWYASEVSIARRIGL